MSDINIGEKVRNIRMSKSIGLRELAKEVNLSPSLLSQIETENVNPSINTLKTIAKALHVPLYIFFQEDTFTDELIVRKGNNKTLGRPGEEVEYLLLTPNRRGQIEFCIMKIPPEKSSGDTAYGHDGEETAYVLSGAVEVYLNESQFMLEQGDAILIPPLTPHRWVNPNQHHAEVIFAVTPPSF